MMISKFRRRLLIDAARKKNNKITYPGLIAAWSAKGKSNDDADRAILHDLTGNGYDLTLNNFAFGGMSGYGGFKYGNGKYAYTSIRAGQVVFEKTPVNGDFSFKTTGLKDALDGVTLTLRIVAYINDGSTKNSQIDRDTNEYNPGEEYYTYHIPEGATHISMEFYGMGSNPNCNVTIEFLPEYPDALVFDGVDDYAFRALDDIIIGKNFTVIFDRQWLYTSEQKIQCMANILNITIDGSGVSVESNASIGGDWFTSWRNQNIVLFINKNMFDYNKGAKYTWYKDTMKETNVCYNGMVTGNIPSFQSNFTDGKSVYIGRCYANMNNYRYAHMAFYGMYIFNRVLDEEEIKSFVRTYIDPNYTLPNEASLQ